MSRLRSQKLKLQWTLESHLFDQADVYGVDGGGQFGDSELFLGEVFRRTPSLRNRMVLATKGVLFWVTLRALPKEYIRKAVEDSLKE